MRLFKLPSTLTVACCPLSSSSVFFQGDSWSQYQWHDTYELQWKGENIVKKYYNLLVKLHWWLSKMARADWSRTSFSLAIITTRWLWQWRLSVFKMAARFVDVLESQIFVFVLFSRIITSAILLKQLVTSGSVNIDFVSVTIRRYSRRLRWLIIKCQVVMPSCRVIFISWSNSLTWYKVFWSWQTRRHIVYWSLHTLTWHDSLNIDKFWCDICALIVTVNVNYCTLFVRGTDVTSGALGETDANVTWCTGYDWYWCDIVHGWWQMVYLSW